MRCLICEKGELAGNHDWKTGFTKSPYVGHPKGHKFVADMRNNEDSPWGYKDKFVALKHKKERY